MTQENAIKRTSLLLQKLFHDDEESIATIKVAEKNKDIDSLTSALDQLQMTCIALKQGLQSKGDILRNEIQGQQINGILNTLP